MNNRLYDNEFLDCISEFLYAAQHKDYKKGISLIKNVCNMCNSTMLFVPIEIPTNINCKRRKILPVFFLEENVKEFVSNGSYYSSNLWYKLSLELLCSILCTNKYEYVLFYTSRGPKLISTKNIESLKKLYLYEKPNYERKNKDD